MPNNSIDESLFKVVKYTNTTSLFFDKNYKFHVHFGHKLKTKKFLYYRNLIGYLQENPDIKIFFTLDENIKPFKRFRNGLLINMDSYLDFCKSISRNTKGRAQAFLGQHLKISELSASEEEKLEFMKTNAGERELLKIVKSLPQDSQRKIKDSLDTVINANVNETDDNIGQEAFINAFSKFLTDPKIQNVIIQNYPQVQINTLKDHLKFLKSNLDKNEGFIQKWLDENGGKYRKQRCLIFGLEYIDHKREGLLSGKRFDLLTKRSEKSINDYVIFELKSPNDEVFDKTEKSNKNAGIVVEYKLSDSLSRALPQILNYKFLFENATDEELKRIDTQKGKVAKCIILIGKRHPEDEIWERAFNQLNGALSQVEILTYTDLIEHLKNCIKNLEENL